MKYLKPAFEDLISNLLFTADSFVLLFMPWRWNDDEQRSMTFFGDWASVIQWRRISLMFHRHKKRKK